ncbi:alpha/beta hydrolase [Buchananella hordeovulneris]|uniref:alpha/beta hydrolase n=1 Tax=Buchananella hordeovulneris TaxID=52770 RepID=UPI0026DD28EC|nr:alpha/beta hydrolase-fold protein [Buchananella hordeovulneris]MDO5081205.1 alpha/beta hydrolase-fold protein [Buchananella hordeovulneris]
MSRFLPFEIATSNFVLILVLVAATVLLGTTYFLATRGTYAAAQGGWGTWRRRLAALAAVLLCQVLVVAVFAARTNQTMRWAVTLGDLVELLGAEIPAPSALLPLTPTATTDKSAKWHTNFAEHDTQLQVTHFAGPTSGVSDDVWVWTPRHYSPTDKRPHNVLLLLHGDPGTPDGMLYNLDITAKVQQAIDSGVLPPTLVVAPALSVDAAQRAEPDCADFAGRARVGTWVQVDVPRMLRANFPNVSADREAWALGGVSSGGYCAVWTVLQRSSEFGTAVAFSAYDAPQIGGLAQANELRAAHTLSHLVQGDAHSTVNWWLTAAQDDRDATHFVRHFALAAPQADHVARDLVPAGGHAWALWRQRLPHFLSWWGAAQAGQPIDWEPTESGPQTPVGLLAKLEEVAPLRHVGVLVAAWGLLGVLTVLAAFPRAVLLARRRWWGRMRGDRERGATPPLPTSEVFIPRRLWRLVSRGVWLGLASLGAVLAAGLGVNRWGEFYPTWQVAFLDLASIW